MQWHLAPPGALRFQRLGHALLFLLLACAATAQTSTSAPSNLIQPGDILNISVAQDASFNGRYQVHRGGYIIVPAVGRIQIAGDTMPAAQTNVESALESTQLEHATVAIEKFAHSADIIYVTGRVSNPGPLPFKSSDNLGGAAAILQAGGLSRYADPRRTYIMRGAPGGTEIKIPVDIKAIMDKRAPDIPLEKDDLIVVPEKFFSY